MLTSGALLLAASATVIAALALGRAHAAEAERARVLAQVRELAKRLGELERSAVEAAQQAGAAASLLAERGLAEPADPDGKGSDAARDDRGPRTVH